MTPLLCLRFFPFEVFPGNNDENTVVKHYLRHNVTALLVRFFPETYFTYPAMRVEVYGGKGTFTHERYCLIICHERVYSQ